MERWNLDQILAVWYFHQCEIISIVDSCKTRAKKILLDFRQNIDGENCQKWLICDGSVDYKWAENLESLMTSGVLTVHSGEELTISSQTKLIFETSHLRDVRFLKTSQCFFLYLFLKSLHNKIILGITGIVI